MCMCDPNNLTPYYCGKGLCTRENYYTRAFGPDASRMDIRTPLDNAPKTPAHEQWEMLMRTFREMGLSIIKTKDLEKLYKLKSNVESALLDSK